MKQQPFLSVFLKYTSLSVLGMIGLSCYILADTFFVSLGLGTNGLTALNLAIPIYNFIHGTGLMLGMGGATRYSICKNVNRRNADVIFTNTLYLTAGFACFFFVCGLLFSKPITYLLGADKTVFQMTETYLRVILLFSPAFLLNDLLICFVRNDENPKLAMIAMLTGSLSNIILDYVFIFPLKMGIFGAVFATGLAPVISVLVLSVHKLQKKNQFHITAEKPQVRQAISTLSIGVPSLVAEVSSGIVISIFNSMLLRLQGNIAVAAYGVVANLSLVVIAIFTGIAQGIQPLISSAYGKKDKQNIHTILLYAFVSIFLLSVVIYSIIFYGANPIAQIFNREGNMEMQTLAVDGLRIYFVATFFVSFNIILSAFFASINRPRPAQAISLLRGFFLIIPMAYFLSWLWHSTGVWMAFPATELCVAILGICIFCNYHKTQKGR